MKTFSEIISTTCKDFGICDGGCGDAVHQNIDGHWFITMGHPGFNSETNNRLGYKTKRTAMNALRHFAGILPDRHDHVVMGVRS